MDSALGKGRELQLRPGVAADHSPWDCGMIMAATLPVRGPSTAATGTGTLHLNHILYDQGRICCIIFLPGGEARRHVLYSVMNER
jgi:hypothetical protein